MLHPTLSPWYPPLSPILASYSTMQLVDDTQESSKQSQNPSKPKITYPIVGSMLDHFPILIPSYHHLRSTFPFHVPKLFSHQIYILDHFGLYKSHKIPLNRTTQLLRNLSHQTNNVKILINSRELQ
jgi:hypothetical protein